MSFYGYTEGQTSVEYNSTRAPVEFFNGYPTHGHGFPCSGEALGAYQNMIPGLVEQIKEGLGQPMKELQDEVIKLRAEISRIKETVQQKENNDDGNTEGKKAKLPKILSLAVKRLHTSAENHFDGSKCYGDRHNVEVADYLKGKLVVEYESHSETVINRAVYRYYESTRRKHLDDQPGRLAAKERNQRNTKIRNRQKQVYNRRKKLCKETEKKFWNELTEKFMTEEETDSDDLDTFVQRLEKFIKILKKRDHKRKTQPRKKRRCLDEFNDSTAPAKAPSWAVAPAHQMPSNHLPGREDLESRRSRNSAALSDQTPRRENVIVAHQDRHRNSPVLRTPRRENVTVTPQDSRNSAVLRTPRRENVTVTPQDSRNSAALSDWTPRRENVTITPQDSRNSAGLTVSEMMSELSDDNSDQSDISDEFNLDEL